MTDETLYCYIHPNRPTTLRCNRCERPICTEDAVLTPTGYRCRNCVREQQKKFDTAQWYDYIVAFIVAAIGSGITSVLVFFASQFFFGILVLFLAPGAGVVIGNIVLRFIRNRRSRALFLTSAVGIVVGAVPALLRFALPIILALIYGSLGAGLGAILPAIWEVVYLFLAVPAAYTQISGIRIGG
jgi:predicted membrane channel-forming protein YqfA (hemolysin III family)